MSPAAEHCAQTGDRALDGKDVLGHAELADVVERGGLRQDFAHLPLPPGHPPKPQFE